MWAQTWDLLRQFGATMMAALLQSLSTSRHDMASVSGWSGGIWPPPQKCIVYLH